VEAWKPPTVEARLLRLSARTDPAYASRSTRISRLDEFDAFFPSSQGGFFGENVFAKGEYLDKGYVERAEEAPTAVVGGGFLGLVLVGVLATTAYVVVQVGNAGAL